MTFICVVCQEFLNHPPHSDQNSFRVSGSRNGVGNKNNTEVVAVKCGHVFHLICLNNWFRKKHPVAKPECPQCRRSVLTKDMLKIFLSVDGDTDDLEVQKKEIKELKEENRYLKDEVKQLGFVLEDTGKELEAQTNACNHLQLKYSNKVDEVAACRLEVKQLKDQMNNNVQVPSALEFQDRGIASPTLKEGIAAAAGVRSSSEGAMKNIHDSNAKTGLETPPFSQGRRGAVRPVIKRLYVAPRVYSTRSPATPVISRVSTRSTNGRYLLRSGSSYVAQLNSARNDVNKGNATASTRSENAGPAPAVNKKARRN